MPFVHIKGLQGKVFVPDPPPTGEKKHPCRDCYACQSCSEDRCRICRGPRSVEQAIADPGEPCSPQPCGAPCDRCLPSPLPEEPIS